MDELDDRVRRLDAERMRPDPPGDPTVQELLTRLIATITRRTRRHLTRSAISDRACTG